MRTLLCKSCEEKEFSLALSDTLAEHFYMFQKTPHVPVRRSCGKRERKNVSTRTDEKKVYMTNVTHAYGGKHTVGEK